ncbi:hypothetical protein CUT44_32230 [Streptomyces carminius]|uniref:Uncharacterized protein n=1 Tax=Streptomyces carminius TaxID=2665496 RepID=A0A2M8LPL1_9ACTN|nr:hypothetical protein CUT44_32230 [Streptomyces carminius]
MPVLRLLVVLSAGSRGGAPGRRTDAAAGGFAEFAGLAAAWLRRGATVHPAAVTAPTLTADDLTSPARTLTDD